MPSLISLAAGLFLAGQALYDGMWDGCDSSESAPPVRQVAGDHRLPNSVRVTRSPDVALLTPSKNKYVVRCKLISTYKPKQNSSARLETPLLLQTPPVTVHDGEKVLLEDSSDSTFVLGRRTQAGNILRITRKIKEGSSVEISVVGVDNGQAVVDVTAQMLSTNGASPESESVRLHSLQGRLIERVTLGKKCTAQFQDFDLEVEVESAEEWFTFHLESGGRRPGEGALR